MDQKDYHFYDPDDKAQESKHLLDVQWEVTPSEARGNPTTGLLAAGLAALLLLTAATLAWVIFHKNRSPVILVHAIISTIALLFTAYAVVWALGARSALTLNRTPNANISFIIFIGSLVFAIYHIVAALFIWIHVNFHLDYALSTKMRPEDWKFHFWDYEFDYALLEDWRIFLVLAIFAVIIAALLALVAHTAWSFLANKVETKKIVLALSLISITAFGFLTVIWHEDYYVIFNALRSLQWSAEIKLYKIVAIIAMVALGLAFANAIVNFLKLRSLNFVLALVWVALFFVLAVFTAFLFRDIQNFSAAKKFKADNAAYLVHEDLYGFFCGGKYIDSGSAGASLPIYRWEEKPVVLKALNPSCEVVSNDLLIWEYYIFAIFAAFLLASVAVAAITNFALSTADTETEAFKRFHIIELIGLIVIVGLGLGLGLWLIFRPLPEPVHRYSQSDSYYVLDTSGSLIANPANKHLVGALVHTLGQIISGK